MKKNLQTAEKIVYRYRIWPIFVAIKNEVFFS